MSNTIYRPAYGESWALVIGINKYLYVNPLDYARNDAEAISDILINKFGFQCKNVITLYDTDATKNNILKTFMRFSSVDRDDRLLVFYAGHGHTIRGNRNDIGYLIPVDGQLDDLSSFIRWDELTRNTEVIPAKHILFIMDACFSGLAITRGMQPGSMRYLKDMLQRYSVQVLAAGKANEVVADANGPIPEHSIFTGHLLKALDGYACLTEGILTANNVMSYVFEKVSKDEYSQQTPHYGYIAGDGDFIFDAPVLKELTEDIEIDKDILIEIPGRKEFKEDDDIIEIAKEYISNERYKIKLDTLVTKELRWFLELTGNDKLTINARVTNESIFERMKYYEKVTHNSQSLVIILAHWASGNYNSILRKIITRVADNSYIESGATLLIYLRWYPIILLGYAGCISAIASENYENLYNILYTKVASIHNNNSTEAMVVSMVEVCLEFERLNLFKIIPGHERHYVPRSEYLFKLMQPQLDDILFLGKSYEELFDRFEILFALTFIDTESHNYGNWAPPGRFAYKYRRGYTGKDVYSQLLREAELQKDNWAPLRAGLFKSSYERFIKIATDYKETIEKFGFH